MKPETQAFFLMLLCTLFTSFGQVLLKFGVNKVDSQELITIINLPLFFGLFLYGFALLLMLAAFKKGELSILYPVIASSYIWISIFSLFFFPQEEISILKWGGIFIILISVSILGFSSKKSIPKEGVSHG